MWQLLHMLEDQEVEHLHKSALALLDDMGVVFDDEDAVKASEDAGAKVDLGSQVVHFPPELLMELVSKAPSQFVAGGRTADKDCVMGGDFLLSRPVVGCIFFTDKEGDYHPSLEAEAKTLAHLVDALDGYTWNGAVIYPDDLDPVTRDIAYCKILFENTSKHFVVGSYSPDAFKYMIEMGIVVTGSAKALRERPLFNTLVSPDSPLKYARRHVGWIVEAGKAGIPMGVASAPVMGATGPTTLAGCAVLIHAETLAGIALAELMNPGAPVYYAPRPNVMDMRTGNSLWGPIEMGMIEAGAVQLGRHCGIPCDTLSLRTDSKIMDEQAAYERMAAALLLALTGVNCISGGGLLESVRAVSDEQMIIDAEILSMIRRTAAGIRIDDDRLGVDLIRRLGHGGQFLTEEHTRRYHRREILYPPLADRNTRVGWEAAGNKDVVERARDRAQEELTEHVSEPLDPQVVNELEAILDAAKEALA